MIKSLQQVRGAVGLMNPDEVRSRAGRLVTIGLVARDPAGYAAMEDFLLPAEVGDEERAGRMAQIFREGDPSAPESFDVVLCEAGIPRPRGAVVFDPVALRATVAAVVEGSDAISLALARQFPGFRATVVDGIVHAVAKENALFSLATALPNIVPSVIELPWALGEFASDTAFLTMNQIRMAFQIAGASGRAVGYAEQKVEILSIVAGAFGWRAIARELAGKIPLGGGLIPKGAIAYAGTFVVGKGLEHYNRVRVMPTRRERDAMYDAAYERGRAVAEDLRRTLPGAGSDKQVG
jgi:hypothetical protein